MKRCPQCHRVERDETLAFCRTDGTALIRDSGAVGAEAGTVKFGSAPLSETETRLLSPDITDADTSTPTSLLDAQSRPLTTRELSRPKQRKAVIAITAVVVAGLAISSYFFLARTKKGSIESVAVMPFVNESGNADLEYLSDGMTESLINNLSQLPGLNVKARSSVFRYKGKEVSPQTVGADLKVHAILNGRLVQRGEELTLYLSLVDTQSENQLWGKQYSRKLTNLVALQTEIVRDVSESLKARLSGADEQKMTRNYTANAEAYQLYLKGRFYWNKRTRPDLQKAVPYFEQAIALDSNYALAYTGLSDTYATLATYGERSPDLVPKARAAALKGLSLDEGLAEAHLALGFVLSGFDYDFAGAEREFMRALELQPNYPEAHLRFGRLLTCMGRFEEAHAKFRRALEGDPLSLTVNRNYGDSLLYARKYDESVAQLKKTLELDPDFAQAHQSLATVYQITGRHGESVEGFARSEEINRKPQNAARMRQSFAKDGWQGFLRLGTGKQGISDLPSQAYFAAACYTELGERDQAFAELNKAYETREYRLVFLKVDPRFDSLRGEPQYRELLKKVGFSQ